MSLKVMPKTNREPIPEGIYPAICYSVVDIGLQYTPINKKVVPKIVLTWEIVDDDLREDFGRGKLERRAHSETYTASVNEKSNLYKIVRPWIGREIADGFDYSELAGKPCMLTITLSEGSNGTIYSNVSSVSPLVKGLALGEPENPIIIYDIDESSEEVWGALPEWIRKKIQESKSPNAQAANSVNVVVDESTGEVIESKVEKPAPVAKPPVSAPKAAEPPAKAEPVVKTEPPKIDGIPDEGEEDYPF